MGTPAKYGEIEETMAPPEALNQGRNAWRLDAQPISSKARHERIARISGEIPTCGFEQ